MTAAPIPLKAEPRFRLMTLANATAADFAADVRTGLTSDPKSLPPRWFYDALGSTLFDAICFLPEYYVMRAETEVLTSHAREIADSFGSVARLVELGSGAARKTRILLDPLTQRTPSLEYVPVDVDATMLERSGRELLGEYDTLRITALAADFTQPAQAFAQLPLTRGKTVVLFLGSTIGNLDPESAISMLRELRGALGSYDALLLGADLRKPRAVLEPAYDDALGVTAAFNRNVLARINRELGGEFDLAAFAHRAFYDEARARIEMHLVSTKAQRVRVGGFEVDLAEGETIHTENSYKHDANSLAALARDSGFTIYRTWTDSQNHFADLLLVPV